MLRFHNPKKEMDFIISLKDEGLNVIEFEGSDFERSLSRPNQKVFRHKYEKGNPFLLDLIVAMFVLKFFMGCGVT
jgi:hypothetical protein